MNNFPNLTNYGYQIIEQIGNNTWKAQNLNSNQLVLVKQFCFATDNSSWSGYQAYQQEVSILQNIDHPGIPQYIKSFETENGFCLISEYIQGQNLDKENSSTTQEIKIIAKKILKILVYLQRQNPAILHLNITPKNILMNESENIYLVDFSRAVREKIASDNTINSITKTSDLIALQPDRNPDLTSDLYSLGVNIICLLTKKRYSEIIELTTPDNPYKIQFKSLVSDVDTAFINWVEKMVYPQANKRFLNAKSALKALKEIDWDLEDSAITTQQKYLSQNLTLSLQKYTFSALTMVFLGIATGVGFHVANRVTEKTIINITIAAIAMIVVYIAQYGAVTAFKTDPEGKTETIIFAIATPITLTVVAGFIFGIGEAVAMSFATIIAQTAILILVSWQRLAQDNNKFKLVGLLSTVLLGIILGMNYPNLR